MPLVTRKGIHLNRLPSIVLEERKRLPNVSAVYFVLTARACVLYIGETGSLCMRWRNHNLLPTLRDMPPDICVAWLETAQRHRLQLVAVADFLGVHLTSYTDLMPGGELAEYFTELAPKKRAAMIEFEQLLWRKTLQDALVHYYQPPYNRRRR
jgi:hypothetical protein